VESNPALEQAIENNPDDKDLGEEVDGHQRSNRGDDRHSAVGE